MLAVSKDHIQVLSPIPVACHFSIYHIMAKEICMKDNSLLLFTPFGSGKIFTLSVLVRVRKIFTKVAFEHIILHKIFKRSIK